MARCGCNTAMSTTCDAIMTCIADNLGAGLDFNETTRQIELRISADSGNTASIGTDDGFYAPAATGPGPMTWPVTVATLPAQAIGATGGGIGVGPSTSPYLVEYCISNGIDMYDTTVLIGSDGTAIETIQAAGSSMTTFTDNPGSLRWGLASSLTMTAVNYDAGTRVNPTGNNSNAPDALLTPDGGWAGFYENQYRGRSVAELLRLVRGRIVVDLRIGRTGMTPDEIEAAIIACVQAVVDAGAQDWCIVNVTGYLADGSPSPVESWVPLVTSQGITAAVNLITEATSTSIQPVANIVASGATWVSAIRDDGMDDTVTDARISELVGAGLQVMARTSSRQYWTDYNFDTLGVRSVEGPDPVYARGARGQAGDLDYRQTFIPGLETRTAISGALTPVTDNARSLWNGGFAQLPRAGRYFPARYGWSGTTSRFANNQLLGTICPIPDTVNFRIRIQMWRESAPTFASARWAGIFWGNPGDRDISQLSGTSSNPNRDGYNCVVHEATGGVRAAIYRHDNGTSTTLVSTTTGEGWEHNVVMELTVTVTGSAIEFQVTSPNQAVTLNTVDATYRGPYVFYDWNDSGLQQFMHGYDNGPGLVMYEALS